MNLLFHYVDIHEQTIRDVLSAYLSEHGETCNFLSVSRVTDVIPNSREPDSSSKYLAFYAMSSKHEPLRIRGFIKKHHLQAKIIALCETDEEGIRALGNGSDYALLIPLSAEKIIYCYKQLQ